MLPDVICVGRVSVDLYASELGAGFDRQQSFTKSVGGSPTNVAVAAARLGRRAAVVTKVGSDGFGDYVRARLAEWGVGTQFIGVQAGGRTPLALIALDPPESPQIAFYRDVAAPDTTLVELDLPTTVVRSCPLLWISHAALAQGSTARATEAWLEQRGRATHTVLDLDFRPALWGDVADARRAARAAIGLSTVVVGNRDECEMAMGTGDPDGAADALLSAGVGLAIVKLGGDGVLLASHAGRWRIAPIPVEVICGLGAGDAFGGVLAHGLIEGWDTPRIGRFANAAGALVATRLTCSDAMPSLIELQALVAEGAP
jgi:5-dehydro-2-deoxygluconokinase